MNDSSKHDKRIAKMTFASVYPHYLAKVEKKGRTREELHQVIQWLTGYNEKNLKKHIQDNVTFEQFFAHANLNPNARLITGVICSYPRHTIGSAIPHSVAFPQSRTPLRRTKFMITNQNQEL